MTAHRSHRVAVAVGAALVAAYVLAAMVTTQISPFGVRPLFEGFGPPPAYRWAAPPPELASGNVKPSVLKVDVPLGPKGSQGKAGDTDQSQIIINLPDNALAPHGSDTSVEVIATPLAPAGNGPAPPSGLAFDGNLYKVTATYRPSGDAVTTLAAPGNIIMRYPTSATTLLFSPDGSSWRQLKTLDFGGSKQLGGDFAAPGLYVLAGPPSKKAPSPSGGGGGLPVPAIVGIGAGALALLLVVAGLRSRRRR